MLKSFKTLSLLGLGGGVGGYLYLKISDKNIPKIPDLEFTDDPEAKYDLQNNQYKLKTRDQHLQEAQTKDYDILIVGNQSYQSKF